MVIKYKRYASTISHTLARARVLWAYVRPVALPVIVVGTLVLGCGLWALAALGNNKISPFVFEVPFLQSPLVVSSPAASPSTPTVPGVPSVNDPHAYGFSAGELVDLNDTQLNARLDDFKHLGMTWVRIDMPWSVVQAVGPTAYNWSTYDRVFEALHQKDLKILVVLDYSPSWARQTHCAGTERCPPINNIAFANYAAAAVNRYRAKVKHWEVWNEPNHSSFWGGTADAQAYTKLLIVTYNAIKGQDPSAFVITGGLAPAFTQGGDIAPVSFLQTMYASGAKGHFDAVGDHAYSYPATPRHEFNWSGWIQMRNLRPVMVDNGDYAKPIWITEYGAPTRGPGVQATSANYNFSNSPDHVDESLQAEIARQAVALYKSYSWVGPMFWYQYKDRGTDTSTNENFFGILRADGGKKPAYAALREAIGR